MEVGEKRRNMAATHETQYRLRNDKQSVYQIEASVTKSGKSGLDGAEITGTIQSPGGSKFTYLVEFGGDFVVTKENFTPEMFLHTAISIMESQIESKRHVDTWLQVYRHSGLTETRPLSEKK